jgi:hypothetical protein
MKFYLLLFERDPRKSYKAFHDDLTTDPRVSTWLHYVTNAYILGTDLDEGALAELVQKLLVKHSLPSFFLVITVDLDHFAGFLPNAAWNWLHESSIRADLGNVEQAISKEAKEGGEQVVRIPMQITSKTTARIGFSLTDPARVRELRDDMREDLETLAQLAKDVSEGGLNTAEKSWIIVQENLVETAEVLGFRPVESTDSELKQAVYFLTFQLNSQNIMIAAYGLAAALQKAKNNPDGKMKAADTERFVTNCKATIEELRSILDETIEPK